VKRLYTPLDLEGSDYVRISPFPENTPNERGLSEHVSGTPLDHDETLRFWTARTQQSACPLSLNRGCGAVVAFDCRRNWVRLGSSMAEELWEVGVAVDTLAIWKTIFEGIPLVRFHSMTINGSGTVLPGHVIALGEKSQGVSRKLMGTTQNDILKELLPRARTSPPERASGLSRYCGVLLQECSKWNTLSITGYHFREAGGERHPGACFHSGRCGALYRKGERKRA